MISKKIFQLQHSLSWLEVTACKSKKVSEEIAAI